MADVTPFDLFNKKKRLEAEVMKPVADAIAAERLAICKGCDHFKKFTKQCSICHCFMPAKVQLSGATCALPNPQFPGEIRKWDVVLSAVNLTKET